MHWMLIATCFCADIFLGFSTIVATESFPPHFTSLRDFDDTFFFLSGLFHLNPPNKLLTLSCKADGIPKPEITWQRNNEELNTSAEYYEMRGSYLVLDASKGEPTEIQGKYRCTASNEYGKVKSPAIPVRQISVTDPSQLNHEKNVAPVDSLTLRCRKYYSVPGPTVSWQRKKDDISFPVEQTERIQMDDEGNLHFAYVNETDFDQDSGNVYYCSYKVKMTDSVMTMDRYTVDVKRQVTPVSWFMPYDHILPPELMFSTGSEVVALVGVGLSLKCFFSGFPLPRITWTKLGDDNFTAHGHQLDLFFNETGNETYRCTGKTYTNGTFHDIRVKVQERPNFDRTSSNFRDMNVTEGDNVTIRCSPSSFPPAVIEWYRNEELLSDGFSRRYKFSPDRKTLTIENACKSCDDVKSDLAVLKCRASNDHGTAVRMGYVNVLQKTQITSFFNGQKLLPDRWMLAISVDYRYDKNVTLGCFASSDPITKVQTSWYNTTDGPVLIHPSADITFSLTNDTMIIKPKYSWVDYFDNYSCKVTNGYSSDEKTFSIIAGYYSFPPKPKRSELSWIAFLVSAAMLLLVFLLFAISFCGKKRRATYLVDEKERENGNDPVKELESNGFQTYARPSNKLSRASHISLISSGRSLGDGSLNEYDDNEAFKYDEDGSFIGRYVADDNNK